MYAIGALAIAFLAVVNVAGQQSPSTAPDTLLRDAAKALTSGKLGLAETDLQAVLRDNPEDYRALNLLGIVRAQQQRDQEAEQLFKRVIEVKPDFAGGHAGLGLLYIRSGRPNQAIPEFQEVLRLDPDRQDIRTKTVDLLRAEARESVGADNSEKALASLLQAKKLNPDNADVQFELGMVTLRMSLYADSMEAFQKVLEKRVDDPLALYGLGRSQMGAGKFLDAKTTFTRYVHDRSTDPSGHYALGLALQALQENRDARAQFERSITLRPAQTESYFRLGVIDLDENDWEAAARNFQTVLDRDKDHAGALAGLGRVEFQQKRYENAADLLQRAVGADPLLREAHYFLGLTYGRLNRKDDSDRELQTATRLEHEEVQKQQQGLKVIDLEDGTSGNQSEK
jgi:tetratricopeptide (TPR) repeat protein